MKMAILKPILMGIASGCLAAGMFGFFELSVGVIKSGQYMLDRILSYSALVAVGVWLVFATYGL